MFKNLLKFLSLLIIMMTTSSAQISRIKSREQFAARAYLDGQSNGVNQHSIGYGHQIQLHEQQLLTQTITVDTATKLLQSDLKPLEIQINNMAVAKYPFTQNQFDALIDFGYNCGSGALSKVLGTFRSNPANTAAVTNEISQYNKTHTNGNLVVSSELTSRRAAEIALFNSAVSPAAKNTMIAGAAILGGLALFGIMS